MSIKAIKYKQTCPNCHKDYLIRYSPYASGCMGCLTYYLADHMIYQYQDLEKYVMDDFLKEEHQEGTYAASLFTQLGNQKLAKAVSVVAAAYQSQYLNKEMERVKNQEELLFVDDLMIQHINQFLAGYESVNYELIRKQLVLSLQHDHDEDLPMVDIRNLDTGVKEYRMAIYEHLKWMAIEPSKEEFYVLLSAYLRLLESELVGKHSEFYDDYEQFENVYHYYGDEYETKETLYLKSISYTYRGLMLEQRSLYEDALTWYEKACKIINRFKETTEDDDRALRKYFCHMGHLNELLGDYEEASAFYSMATDLLGDKAPIHYDNDELSAMATMNERIAWSNDCEGIYDNLSENYASAMAFLKTSIIHFPDLRTLRSYIDIVTKYAISLDDRYLVPHAVNVYEILVETYERILKSRDYLFYRYNYCVSLYNLTKLYKMQVLGHYEETKKKTIEAFNALITDFPEMEDLITYIQDEDF